LASVPSILDKTGNTRNAFLYFNVIE